tara:strand:- start:489 stop:1070 length:582 start_codon:yes stop_codon:yes gene_type:complete
MDKRYLDKVIEQIISETRIDYEKEKVYTPFLFLNISLFSFPHPIFATHCEEVYGLDKEETEYVWDEYTQIINYKIYVEGAVTTEYVNESNNIDDDGWYYQYVFNSKFLSKVLGQLLSETKIEWDDQEKGISVKVAWDPYIGYQRDVSYPLFQRHCKEVYLLTPIEIADVYMLYMTELSERRGLRLKDKIRNNG